MKSSPVQLTPLTKPLRLRVSSQQTHLPDKLQADIAAYWQERISENPHLFNGEAFTVVGFAETPEAIQVELSETDFAHNLYSENFDAGEHAYRVIHSACYVITSDNKIVVGKMSKHTARAGIICCSGGGIDKNDIRGNEIDLEHSTAHELREELGIDPYDTHVQVFVPVFLKTGGPRNKMTVLYELRTDLASDAFTQKYAAFTAELTKQHGDIEYERLFYIDNTPTAVEAFIEAHSDTLDEYLPILLRTISSTTA